MSHLAKPEPLGPAELDRLAEFLVSCGAGDAMNLEELDGFFAALIAGPENVMPSEYLPEVFGSNMAETRAFESIEEANQILQLLMRHWNTIVGSLFNEEAYIPLLLPDERGVVHGNDWAHGFVRGMEMRSEGWEELARDKNEMRCLIPVMMLHYEHDEHPSMRPQPITPKIREEVVAGMAMGLLDAYQFFRERRADERARVTASRNVRPGKKVGRNVLCPCGSGKKYKKCCGGMVVQ